jgi:hypothetical protein
VLNPAQHAERHVELESCQIKYIVTFLIFGKVGNCSKTPALRPFVLLPVSLKMLLYSIAFIMGYLYLDSWVIKLTPDGLSRTALVDLSIIFFQLLRRGFFYIYHRC